MGWNIIDSGFQIVLSGEIPNLVKDQVGKNIYNFLNQNLDQSKKISFYIAHPGGPKVLDALCESLDLPKDHLALSWKSLKEHGNTSATSVINVLEQTIKEVDINPNSMGLMMAMGPAFCLELGVLRKC
jgi:alkylresorcinol/alkylpyrone synthase